MRQLHSTCQKEIPVIYENKPRHMLQWKNVLSAVNSVEYYEAVFPVQGYQNDGYQGNDTKTALFRSGRESTICDVIRGASFHMISWLIQI